MRKEGGKGYQKEGRRERGKEGEERGENMYENEHS